MLGQRYVLFEKQLNRSELTMIIMIIIFIIIIIIGHFVALLSL